MISLHKSQPLLFLSIWIWHFILCLVIRYRFSKVLSYSSNDFSFSIVGFIVALNKNTLLMASTYITAISKTYNKINPIESEFHQSIFPTRSSESESSPFKFEIQSDSTISIMKLYITMDIRWTRFQSKQKHQKVSPKMREREREILLNWPYC